MTENIKVCLSSQRNDLSLQLLIFLLFFSIFKILKSCSDSAVNIDCNDLIYNVLSGIWSDRTKLGKERGRNIEFGPSRYGVKGKSRIYTNYLKDSEGNKHETDKEKCNTMESTWKEIFRIMEEDKDKFDVAH